jgi:PAS domain S-box-containing protein
MKRIFDMTDSRFNNEKQVKNRLLSFLIYCLVTTIIFQPLTYSQQKEEQLSTKEKLLNLLKESELKESKKDTGFKKTSETINHKVNSKIITKPIDETVQKEISQKPVNPETHNNISSKSVSSLNNSKEVNKSNVNEFPYLTIILLFIGLSFAIIIINKWRYNNMKMKKYKDWKTFSKIFALIVVSLIPMFLIILFYFLPQVEHKLYEEKETATKHAVEVASSVLNVFDTKVTENKMSLEQAQEQATSVIKTMRYEGKEYFWINDLEPKMIMHPFKPELNGKDLSENKDPNGKHLFVEMVNVCKEKNEGFVDYMWEKPGASMPMPKISYVKLFSKWGWIVGSGIYVDDVEEEIASLKQKILIGFLFISVLILILTYFFAKRLTKPLILLTDIVDKIASDKLNSNEKNIEINIDSNDEIGTLSKSFSVMMDKISEQLQYLNNLPTPVMIINKEFNIQYMNKMGADILGKNQQELIGQKCYDNFKTGDCRTDKCACAQAMSKDMTAAEETVANPNGKSLPILYTGAPIKDKSGKIKGAVEFITDITDVKNAQNYLSNKTDEMLNVMNQFAKGDLTVELVIEKDDQIGKLFNGFNKSVKNIGNLISSVTEAVQATASAANEISSSTEQMAAGAQEQSAQATEVAGAVEEMTKTIYETTKNTGQATEASKNSGRVAKEGGKVVEETIHGMNRIAEVVRKSAETVQALGKSSDQIGEIVQVIDDIADQTNLLALNAAIEAARAGEQGRGFAVVADEVRKLAERTTKATKEIATMIKQIQKDTSGAVESMEQGTKEVEVGKQLAEKAGTSLQEIIHGAEQVLDIVSQVAAASEEQSSASEQISKNIESISSVTQESASGIQQIAHASEDLNRLTLNLQELVARFKVDENGGKLAVRQNGKLVHV